jgi:indole-3-glycerol phosphate synthase
MGDFLDTLVRDALQTINNGYYDVEEHSSMSHISLKGIIRKEKGNSVITEIKTASPSKGILRTEFDPIKIAKSMEYGGAVGISVLTEPKNFGGNLTFIQSIKESVRIPIMMKDIILDSKQVKAASFLGADAILLIKTIFDRGYGSHSLNEMINIAHSLGLEVLLETHTSGEFRSAIQTEADLVGINNRDLRCLQVDLSVTEKILNENIVYDRIIVSESGIKTPHDLLFLKSKGAQAFLIGSTIMESNNIKKTVRRLVSA